MRSIANTGMSFGMVNIAVKLYSAVEKTGVEFHQHHGGLAGCGGRIGYDRVCKDCKKGVEHADVIRGHELPDGEVVFVSDEEFAQIERETGTSITVEKFVPASEIDTILYNGSSYFLSPNDKEKGSPRAYALMLAVLKESGLVAICRYIYRGAQHTAVARIYQDKVLLLQPIMFEAELREADFPALNKPVEIQPKELELARMVIEGMKGEFVHSDYVDEYQDALVDFIDRKATGEIAKAKAVEDEVPTDVADLVALLQASIQAKNSHPAGKRRGNVEETSTEATA